MGKEHFYYVAAANYSCGTYGGGDFGTSCDAATAGVSGSPAANGGAGGLGGLLADTGYNVLLPVALGVAIVVAAGILLAKRLYRRFVA